MSELFKQSLPLIIATGIPCILVAIGILTNKQDTNRLTGEIRDLRSDLNNLRGDFNSSFAAMQKQQHDDIMRLHGDILMLVQRDTDTQKSIARLEGRS